MYSYLTLPNLSRLLENEAVVTVRKFYENLTNQSYESDISSQFQMPKVLSRLNIFVKTSLSDFPFSYCKGGARCEVAELGFHCAPEFPCNGQIVESGAFISMNRPESQWSAQKG